MPEQKTGPTLTREGTGLPLVINWTPSGSLEGEIEISQNGSILEMVAVPAGAEQVTIDPVPATGDLDIRGRYRRLAEEPVISEINWSPDDPPFEGTTPDVQPASVDAGEYTIQSIQLVFAGTDTPVASEATEAPWVGTVFEELEAGEFDVEWLTTAEGGGDVLEFRSDPITVEVVLQDDPEIALVQPEKGTVLTQGVETSLESDLTVHFGETLDTVTYQPVRVANNWIEVTSPDPSTILTQGVETELEASIHVPAGETLESVTYTVEAL